MGLISDGSTMNVLGLQAFYYNHATALLRDGRLEFFCEEEKLDRVKGQRDGFPTESIKAALGRAGLSMGDIDEIAYPMDSWRYTKTVVKSGLASAAAGLFRRGGAGADADPVSLTADRVLSTLQYTPPFLDSLIRHRIRYGGIPGRLPPIVHVPHHLAHAASAFYTSGFDEATVVIVDGVGETESTSIWRGRGMALERIEQIDFPNSLGEFYAAITEFCGFKVYQQEGKLMGLAAYGGPDDDITRKMQRVLQVRPEGYQVVPDFTIDGVHTHGISFSDALVDLFGPPRGRDEPLTDRHRSIAYAAQDLLERATLEVVKRAVRLTGCRDVCFSGGVAMNCKLNGSLLHSGELDRLSVLPASNDAGVALGAAMYRAAQSGDDPRMSLKHTYYGPSFSDEEIEATLINAKVAHERLQPGDYDEVADLLMSQKVIGLYTGRMEFGARALGARSIIADPRQRKMWDVVNEAVKHREAWRPFAPVILEGHEAEYWEDPSPSPFMMMAFDVRPDKRDIVPAVTHVDGSCRPQSISRDVNPVYWGILEAFHRKTGVPVLMNTSFNVRGEPIVCRPVEALRCYLATGMDALVIGSFLLRKG
jgi:carbamoyltransferase